MDYQNFLTRLPELFNDWGKETIQPKSDLFSKALSQIQGMTTANVMQLLNCAVAQMDAGEIYCEVGTYRGSTLVGAMLEQSGKLACAVDNFSEFDTKGENLAKLQENLSGFNLQEQVIFHNQDFEGFLIGLQQQYRHKVGVYFYDGAHDYRSQLMGLLLATPLLADGALIVIDDSNSDTVQQGIWDFIAAYPNCRSLLNLPTPIARHPSFWNGIHVLGWSSSWEHAQVDFKQNRQPVVIQSIYDLYTIERKYADAKQFLAEGRLDFAIALAAQCHEVNPNFAPAHEILGQAYQAYGKTQEAIAAYNRAIELNPESVSAETYNQLGIALAEQGKLSEAIASFHHAIALQPENVDAYYNLGVALAQQGELDAAIDCFQSAVIAQPSYINAWFNLVTLLEQQNRWHEAIDCYQQVLEIQPDDADTAHLLAIALRQL
jgi:protein O-GlcNAc transferase